MPIARYYCNDPDAPRPNSPAHLGANVLLEWDGKLLLEQRWDCGQWGLIGGRLRAGERETQGISRELREETGIFLPETAFQRLRVISDNRIAAYEDGTVWRMTIVLFSARLTAQPKLLSSRESVDLRFFAPEELRTLPLVITHQDLIEAWSPTL